jgi:hypothetical protein
MRRLLSPVVVAILAAPLLASPARADVPKPDFDRVDHAKPAAQLEVPAKVGDVARIKAIGAQLKRPDPYQTLGSIGRWMRRNLRNDSRAAHQWRTFEQMQKDGTYGSSSDHAMFFGVLARACGIPTVWVKTMDVDWILDFRAGAASTYEGHDFLEVFIDGAWRLLDAEGGLLYERYDPRSRLLPGPRFAYDKGGDPYDLVLSSRWDDWKQQTDEFFSRLDLATLPWGRPRNLYAHFTVHVAAKDPTAASWARQAIQALHLDMGTVLEGEFDRRLPKVRGAVLVVLVAGGEPALPEPYRAAWLPTDWKAFTSAPVDGKKDWADRNLDDGTRVVLVRATDEAGVEKAVLEALR